MKNREPHKIPAAGTRAFASPCEEAEPSPLTEGELDILQQFTARWLSRTSDQTSIRLLSQVRRRLEQERRRKIEIRELERMYFCR